MREKVSKISRKVWLGIGAGLFCLAIALTIWIVYDINETARIDAEAITFVQNLQTSYGANVKVSDFLENLNGELIEDFTIDTTKLGEQTITFDFLNLKNKRRQREFTLNITDTTAPTVYGSTLYAVPVNYTGKLTDLILSFDDLDNFPTREISGEYNLAEPGDYHLQYIITDNYNNATKHDFTLRVYEPDPNAPPAEPYIPEKLPIAEVIATHKTKTTKIGIDVSSWQGNIDWQQVKNSGVEFAFLRAGYQLDYNTEYILDKTFQANLAGASAVNLPLGVYFYTYANTVEEAKAQAEWIIQQIGNYKVELGIAFDWEDWADFNNASMSQHTIRQVAQTFIDTAEEHGYTGLLYGSKVYLERIWQPAENLFGETSTENFFAPPVWLAQYYDYATFTGAYKYWQLSSSGTVPGIAGDVDLDIMYLDLPKLQDKFSELQNITTKIHTTTI